MKRTEKLTPIMNQNFFLF